MASAIYVFHITSLYDRRGDETAGADMIDHTTFHIVLDWCVRYIDNVRQYANWKQISRPTRE